MESFIAAHLGERGGRGGGKRGRIGIQRQQIHSSILAPPPIHNNPRIYSIAPLSFIINTESHPTDSTHTSRHTKPCTLVCTHKHTLHFFSRPDPLYVFDGPIHVVCDVADSPLPCCPAFKPSSSSGCLSPGVDCIFYLSFFLFLGFIYPSLEKKKFWGENCNQHNMRSSCCVLACHPPLYMSMQDETDSACRRRHTHAHTDACTIPPLFIKPPTHSFLSLSFSHTEKKTCVALDK